MSPSLKSMIRASGAAALAFLSVLATPIAAESAAALPDGVKKLASVEGITEYQLDNGLKVLLFPDPSKQTATVNITYLVGSKHENYGETGMAHLLEHLVFKGTPDHRDIPQELTEHGARANGTTWYDRTNYYETFAATAENLEWALDLEADRMVNSFIAKEDLDSEMTVVRNEFEMGETFPRGVLMDRLFSTAYLWHNYGKSTIGARSDIENVPIERLQGFYRRYYQPDNAILVVAGKFDGAATLELVAEKFGRIPRPQRVLPTIYTEEPAQDGERSVTLRRVGDLQVVGAAYHMPPGSHGDFAAVAALAHILGDTPSGRLHKELVKTGKAARVYDVVFQLAEPGIAMFFAEVRKESSLEDAEAALLAQIERFGEHPPTEAEVESARAALLNAWVTTMRDSQRAAIRLSEWASRGDWRLMFLHRDRLKKVTPEDVSRVAAAYLKPANRTLGRYIPTTEPRRVEIPHPPDVEALVADYKGGEALASGEAFDTSPAAIEAITARARLGSGMKLVMVPKKSRAEVVQIQVRLHFGELEDLRGRATAASLAAGMLMRGTEKRSRQEIEEELDRLKAQVQLFGDASSAFVTIEVNSEDMEATLRLVGEILRSPSFPEEELELLKEERLAQIEDSKTNPFQVAFTAYGRHMNDYPEDDPRYNATPEEGIERVESTTLDEVRRFYEDFYGASHGELAAVGDFDTAALESLAGELFGDWESAKPYTRLDSPYQDVPADFRKIETPDKETAVFVAGQNLEIRDDDPDYAALTLGNFMTGGGFLSSRLATRLRQKDGLSYSVSSNINASSFEKSGSFFAFAIYAPQVADKLRAAFKEEIEKIVSGGFTAEEIEAAKKGWLQQRQVSRSQERELASRLAGHEYRGRTLEWDAELEARIEALTAEEIHEAMRKHLSVDEMSIIQVGDFARAAEMEPEAAGKGSRP